jgi:hypothetical protein
MKVTQQKFPHLDTFPRVDPKRCVHARFFAKMLLLLLLLLLLLTALVSGKGLRQADHRRHSRHRCDHLHSVPEGFRPEKKSYF